MRSPLQPQAHCKMISRTVGIDAMDQTVDQQPWPLKRVNRVPPMIADVHLATAHTAATIHHVQLPTNQRRF